MSASQPDLFDDHPTALQDSAAPAFEQPPAEFIGRLRDELAATLRTVRQADTLPWSDLTRATLAELRFHSISRWLPDEEATTLCAAFEAEMARLYEREDEQPPTA